MYSPAAGEKTSLIMVYTENMVVRGEVVSSENVRVNTWLRTAGVPEYLHITRAQIVLFGGGTPKSLAYAELFLPVATVIGFHVLPPVPNQVDYASDEKNRIMVPVTALVGSCQFNGHLRISSMSTFRTTIELAHSVWTSMYDAEVSNPFLPQLQTPLIPVALLRSSSVGLALK
jgi:hypothetical protein